MLPNGNNASSDNILESIPEEIQKLIAVGCLAVSVACFLVGYSMGKSRGMKIGLNFAMS